MASKVTRKRKNSAASECGPSLGTQDSIFMEFDSLDLNSQLDDSETQSMLFKKPRISLRRKEIPTGTIASEKLKYIEESFHQGFSLMDLKINGDKVKQKVRPLSGRYIVDLAEMVLTLSEVALWKKCKKGEMELFEMNSRATCASILVFRCCVCNN